MQRPPVLIIGAHRSGTSATAEALQQLGLKIGERLDSHSEPRGLQKAHEEYLHRVGAAWHTPQPLIDCLTTEHGREHCVRHFQQIVRTDFRQAFSYRGVRGLLSLAVVKSGSAWGWKEPRTTLFAPVWLRIFPKPKILHVIRHPLDVALSIQARELKFRAGGDPPNDKLDDLAACVRLAITYLEQGDAVSRLSENYRQIKFEDLQRQPRETLLSIAEFCGLKPTDAHLDRAASAIRPENAGRWRTLPRETARELLAQHQIAARLGYTVDDL